MRVTGIQHHITYIKIHNNNHRQENTGQILEKKRFRSTKSNRTDPTKHIRPSEQKNTIPETLKSNREKDIMEKPIHRITYTRKYGTRLKEGPTNEIVEIVTHQIGIRTINLHLENRHDIIVKKRTFRENMQI